MWSNPVPIFEDEDEEALISQFVELSVAHPHRSEFELCQYIFRDLRDPALRSGQAAIAWKIDLDIQERIRKLKLQGDDKAEIETKATKLRVLEQIYNNTETSAKDRIAAIELHAKIQGEITKAIEQRNINDNAPRFPQIVAAVYPDD